LPTIDTACDRTGYGSNTVLAVFVCLLVIQGCAGSSGPGRVEQKGFSIASLAKTDMGEMIEINLDRSRYYLREMMAKLYKRNPVELRKSVYAGTVEENIVRLFDLEHDWEFPELEGKRGGDAINLSFSPEYRGDRVFSLIAGLLYMLMESYSHRRSFYLMQTPDPQHVYNLARNIEIAIWKLSNSYDENGRLYLYSNSLPGEQTNLSFERLFGKLIGIQDTMAIFIARKTNRGITRIVQQVATAAFLPVF